MSKTGSPFQKWIWIELIEFDPTKDDFGVKDYIDNAGFNAEIISFLIAVDFVLLNDPESENTRLPWDFCTYGGRECGKGSEKPVWTKSDFIKLIKEFHKYNIKVFFSTFDLFLKNAFHEEWVSTHQEVLATTRTGEKIPSINPLCRLEDSSFYDDFFTEKLIEVIKEFNFDGFHCADGCNHLRQPLYWSDYSDDMVEQFLHESRTKLPGTIRQKCNTESDHERRAEWIWQNKRLQWIHFYVSRWERYFSKLVNALHREKKQMIFNTSWTRDPLEAIYRYGIDYKKIAGTGVDWFIKECVGAGPEIGGDGNPGATTYPDFFYKIMATILLTKAYVPETRMVALHAVHDMNENWEVLRHAPTFLEKEGYSYPNLFLHDAQGRLKRCIDGFLTCLGGGISRDEWEWLRYNWYNSYSAIPKSIYGATLIWSDEALQNELKDFINTRHAPTHTILYQLLAKGASVHSMVNINHIDKVSGPLLVINHHNFSAREIRSLMAYKNGELIFIGRQKNKPPKPDLYLKDAYSLLCVSVYGMKDAVNIKPLTDKQEKIPENFSTLEEPKIYCKDLYSRKISDGFLKECAKVISLISSDYRIVNNVPAKLMAVKQSTNTDRLFVRNDTYGYVNAEIDTNRSIVDVTTITKFPYKRISFDGSRLFVRIPLKGIVVLEIIFRSS